MKWNCPSVGIRFESRIRMACLILAMLGFFQCVSASEIVKETFAINTSERLLGGSLGNTTPFNCDRSWTAINGGSDIIFANQAGRDCVQFSGGATGSAFDFIPISDVATSWYALEVDAYLNPGTGDGWRAIGFSANATSGLWSGGTVWMTLSASGSYRLYANAASVTLASGLAPGFIANGWNSVKIACDPVNNSVSCWINGTAVAENLALGSYLPTHNYAAIGLLHPAAGGIADFQVSAVDTSIFEDNFEDGTLSHWTWTSASGFSLSNTGNYTGSLVSVADGRRCLEITVDHTTGYCRTFSIPFDIPLAGAANGRRVLLGFSVRTEGFDPGDVAITLLEQTATGASRWIMDNDALIKVVPSSQWVTVNKTATVLDTTTRLYLYIRILNQSNSSGCLWLDGVNVQALSADSSPLLDTYSGKEGHIIDADTGAAVIDVYDIRDASLEVNVLDETGNSAEGVTIANLSARKVQVTLPEKGYYDLQSTVTCEGFVYSYSTTAAVIGQPADSVEQDATVLGMFGVNSDNPKARQAGGNWNRFFVNYENLIVHPADTSTFTYTSSENKASGGWLSGTSWGHPTSPFDYLPTDQNWIACIGGIPDFLLQDGRTAENRRQWEFYRDRDQFMTSLAWVLKDLPTHIQYIEPINEPEWGNWGGNWDELGQYFLAFRETIDQVNADIPGRNLKLVGPVFAHLPSTQYPDSDTSPDSSYGMSSKFQLLDNLLVTQGVIQILDGISMHAYGDSNQPEQQFVGRVDAFNTYLSAIEPFDMPVFFTEFGWQSGNVNDWLAPVSEWDHAQYVSRSLLLLMARAETHNFGGLLNFCLLHRSSGQANGLDHYSMLNTDSTPRLPYVAYAQTAKHLIGTPQGHITKLFGSWLYVYTAPSADGSLIVLWGPGSGQSGGHAIHLPSSSNRCETLYGRQVDISTHVVSSTNAPHFILADDPAIASYPDNPSGSYTVNKGLSGTSVEFTDMIGSAAFFSLNGTTLSASSGTPSGTHYIIGRYGAIWKLYVITVQ